jgi:hypothetical protein
MDMLNRFFKNDQNTSDTKGKFKGYGAPRAWTGPQWRFKGHAEDTFWRWVCSWARAVRRPSDIGFDDTGFDLPPLNVQYHEVAASNPKPGMLFDLPALGLRDEREESRRTITERCEEVARVLDCSPRAVAWCHLNDEGDLLTSLIPGAVQVSGGMSDDAKEEALMAFARSEIRVLVTKPKIAGWGLNWQHCNHMTFFPSHSYEQYYQAVRRMWRFGQARPVQVDIVATEGGANALANLQRKSDQADEMFAAMILHMNNAIQIERGVEHTMKAEAPAWLS